jgi:transcriptional regulator with XRE-family HTH domain
MLDTSAHARRRTKRLLDPEFRTAYEQTAREIVQIDDVISALDALRIEQDMSKAELARRVARNESSIRRLFSSHRSRPEFALLATIADALGARLEVVVTEPAKGERPEKPERDTKRESNAAKG